jgi:uncharacterized protein
MIMPCAERKVNRLLIPDRCSPSLAALSPERLLQAGIMTVLLDMDNTVLSRETGEVPAEVVGWLSAARAQGLKLCLISNNFHAHAYEVAGDLELPVVAKALKPLPMGVYAAMRLTGSSAKEVALVGDQLFTDVLAAHLAGVFAILVEPLATQDLPHTLWLRRLQYHILKGRTDASAEEEK